MPDMPPRLLFLLPDLAFGGVERVSLNLLRHLPPELASCTLFSCGNSAQMLSEVPAHVRYLPGLPSHLRMRWAFPALVARLRSCMAEQDIVVATSPNTTALMRVAGLGHKVRKITWVHFNAEGFLPSVSPTIRTVSKAVYPLCQERVFVSEGVRASFQRRFGSHANDRVIHNIFDPQAYRAGSLLAPTVAQLKASGKPLLGCVSRLAEHKGLPELVDIHRTLLAKGFDHNLVIIGDGPLRGQLAQEVIKQGLSNSLHLLGADPAPLEAMRLFDLTLLTSEHEAWPTVILESLYVRTPVVAYACPSGPAEMLTGALRQGLVPQRSAPAFADAVIRMHAQRAALVDPGQKRLTAFDPKCVVPQWQQLINSSLRLNAGV